MLIFKLDKAINNRIQMWWLGKAFWIFKFKDTTKTLKSDMFWSQPIQQVHLTFEPTLMKYQQRFYFVVEFFKKVWTWVCEVLNRVSCKSDPFFNVGCCPNIVDETMILTSIVWRKDTDKFCFNFCSIYFHLKSFFSLLLLLLRMRNCTKDNATTFSKK